VKTFARRDSGSVSVGLNAIAIVHAQPRFLVPAQGAGRVNPLEVVRLE